MYLTSYLVAAVLLCKASIFAEAYRFKDYSYEELEHRASTFDGPFASTKTAAELFGFRKTYTKENDTDKEIPGKCSPQVIRVTDMLSEPSDMYRPQLLISGEIHGDERVGPSASMELAALLVHSAECEISGLKEKCDLLDSAYLTRNDRKWLAFLATRRETIIVPTANCQGYKQNKRMEGKVDPNRDFAYSRNNDQCFRSDTARLFYGERL
jgi:hypothetical protein